MPSWISATTRYPVFHPEWVIAQLITQGLTIVPTPQSSGASSYASTCSGGRHGCSSAASMAPRRIREGTAPRHYQKLDEMEKRSGAPAVRNTLAAVTSPVPNFRVSRSDRRLEQIVPPEMVMDTIPMRTLGT